MGFIVGEGLLDTLVVVNDLYKVVFTTIITVAFLHNFDLLMPLQSGFAGPFQQIADDFMTDRRDANFLSLLYQLDDHVRAGVRLARAWRTLNGKHRSVEQ